MLYDLSSAARRCRANGTTTGALDELASTTRWAHSMSIRQMRQIAQLRSTTADRFPTPRAIVVLGTSDGAPLPGSARLAEKEPPSPLRRL